MSTTNNDERQMIALTILLFENSGHWVAQALEYDLASQGRSFVDAIDGLVACLGAQIVADANAKLEPLSSTPKAPRHFFEIASQRGWPLMPPGNDVGIELPPEAEKVLRKNLRAQFRMLGPEHAARA